MIISLWIASGVLLLLTLIPLSHHDAWWVRGLDFPRLQLSLAALGLLAVQVSVLDFSRSADWVMVGLTLLCLGYQLSWILPYTRLHPKEVQWASTSPRLADRDNRIAILVSNVLTPNRHADKLIALVRE